MHRSDHFSDCSAISLEQCIGNLDPLAILSIYPRSLSPTALSSSFSILAKSPLDRGSYNAFELPSLLMMLPATHYTLEVPRPSLAGPLFTVYRILAARLLTHL